MLIVCAIARGQDGSDAARPGDSEPVSHDAVNRAIDRGVAWLRSRQADDGSWGPVLATYYDNPGRTFPVHATGPTSVSVFALATCGVGRDDKAVRSAMRWLRRSWARDSIPTCYESASIILMLVALNRPTERTGTWSWRAGDRGWMAEHVRHLIGTSGNRFMREEGGFSYEWLSPPRWFADRADVSSTHFCLLALREAARAGYPVRTLRPDVWTRSAEFLRRLQLENGAFLYFPGESWSCGRTAAGVASLLICREQIRLAGSKEPEWMDGAIENGFARIDASFDVTRNLLSESEVDFHHFHHLYAVERAGRIGRRRQFGGGDWYARGAAWLVRKQRGDGSWRDRTGHDPQDVLGTCFALLFLKRATAPAVTPPTEDPQDR